MELTRSQNDAQLPLCCDNDTWKQTAADLKKMKKRPTVNTSDICGKCVDMRAFIKKTAKKTQRRKDEDWGATDGESGCRNLHRQQPHPKASADIQPTIEEVTAEQQKLSWDGHWFQQFGAFGMLVVAWDAWKSCIWDLLTHAGFFTYIHHDAGGFATYAFIREGCKIWGILHPKVTPQDSTRSHLYDLMRKIIRPSGNLQYMEHTELFNFFLMKGDIL